LIVLPDPQGRGWIGFFSVRTPNAALAEGSAIAMARSRDLVHWEQQPPVFAPRKYACVEATDGFEMGGKWYMICLTGHEYGNRGIFTDPHTTRGTMYAVAERPEGPYREFKDDNVLLGMTVVQNFIKRRIEKTVKGPSAPKRDAQPTFVWGEVSNARGDKRTARIKTANGYSLTVTGALAVVEHLLAHDVPGGAYTPAKLIGPDLVTHLPGSGALQIA
jgi:hypothetical protein